MFMFEDKLVNMATHEVPYGVAVAIWLLECHIIQAIDDFGEFKEKHSVDKDRVLLNY